MKVTTYHFHRYISKSIFQEILTVRGDNDPKFNPKKHHNQLPEDSHEFWDQCELVTLCDFQVDQKGRGSAFVEPPCTFFAWAGKYYLL